MRWLVLTIALMFVTTASMRAADNWPDYRGPTVDGHTDASNLPLKPGDPANIRWKTPIHGKAWSSPVIWGDQVWLTTATEDGKVMSTLCVDKNSGKVLHDIKLLENAAPEAINRANTYASPSPVIEAGRVYLYFGTYGIICLDTANAHEVWRRTDLKLNHKEGPGSSPFLYKNLLILTCEGMDVQYITALDKATGKTVWKTDRTFDLSSKVEDLRKTYSTPILITDGGTNQLISQGAFCIYSYDPDTGKELWRLPTAGFSTVARPHFEDGVLFVNSGFSRAQLWAVKPTGSGVRDEAEAVIWKQLKNVPRKVSDVYVDGLIIMVDDSGVASALDAKTGEEVWKERLLGSYSASPLVAPGRVYFFSEQGYITVLKPGRTFEVIAKDKLEQGMWASPAVSGNAMFIRTTTDLIRSETP